MFDIGPEKLLFVLLVAFVVLGPQQLPDVARKIGAGMRHWHSLRESLHSQMNSVLDVPTNAPGPGPDAIEADADHSTPTPADDAIWPSSFS
jgi:Sec-independent protein translocase protein TatA